MITRLRLINFKNFADETLRMGSFTVIAGANASGKSNVRDAFRFLHGIGRGYGLADIIGGKYGAGGEVQWEPIRGAAGEIVRFGASCFDLLVTLKLPGSSGKKRRKAIYGIRIGDDEQRPGTFRVMREALSVGQTAIYTSRPPSPDPVRDQDDDAHLLLRMGKRSGPRLLDRPISVHRPLSFPAARAARGASGLWKSRRSRSAATRTRLIFMGRTLVPGAGDRRKGSSGLLPWGGIVPGGRGPGASPRVPVRAVPLHPVVFDLPHRDAPDALDGPLEEDPTRS